MLGLAFKADTDDERDSLAHKLIRLLERELADVAVHDPHVPTPTVSLEEALDGAEVVIVATNHSEFRDPRTLAAIAERAAATAWSWTPGTAGAPPRCSPTPPSSPLSVRERMSRVLVTGGAGTIGAAVVRRLLADPAYEVRVSDQRPAPQWMREGCEVHTGDLRVPAQARAATKGCTHVIHLAAIVGGIANFHRLPHTLTEVNNALYNAVIRAALELEVERFVYVSSSMVFERAELFPTPEDYLPRLPGAALRVRLLEAHRRGLLPRRARRARPAVHDLPPVQRLRPGRGARRRARASPTRCPT